MCLYPRLIKNKRYIMNKKNGGNVPVCNDTRKLLVPVGCTKCIECRKQEGRKWQLRMLEDIKHNKNGKFVTLTFSNESIKEISKSIKGLEGYELDNEIATIAVKRFRERWRKEYKKSIRHWFITELGHNGTENIHLHGIIWTDKEMKKITKHWKYGYTWEGKYVNERTVNYIIKYVKKIDLVHKEYKAKVLTSAGIGAAYIKTENAKSNKYNKEQTREYYTTRTGHKMAMPTYWRNKIYTDEEREELWIQKLNKEERWILGQKIDISKTETEYYKALNEARNKNKRLGYGDDQINWERKQYENERRKIKYAERTQA